VPRLTTEQRFWLKVDRSGREGACWEWLAYRDRGGYGMISVRGRMVLTHRFAYELTFGEIPDGLCVCHRCDNPGCVNPKHLFLGTHQENMNDRGTKGRQVTIGGENHWTRFHPERVASGDRNGSRLHPESRPAGAKHSRPNAKLTEDQVREIRSRTDHQRLCALEFNVPQSTVSRIRSRKSWSWLP